MALLNIRDVSVLFLCCEEEPLAKGRRGSVVDKRAELQTRTVSVRGRAGQNEPLIRRLATPRLSDARQLLDEGHRLKFGDDFDLRALVPRSSLAWARARLGP